MPISVSCPGCGAGLNLADHLAGKTIKCFQCQAAVTVPVADYEVVDDAPPKRARRRDDEGDDRPQKKPARAVVEDEDEDARPRRKAKKKGVPVWVFAAAGGGLLVLIGLVVGGYLLLGGKGGGLLGPSAPPGYSTVGERAVGITVFLPGQVRGTFVRQGGPDGPPNPDMYAAHGEAQDTQVGLSALRTPGFTPGTSPEQLLDAYQKAHFVRKPWKYDVTGHRPVTLGGRPGLEVRIKEKPDLWNDTPQKAEFFKDKNRKEEERVAREGICSVALVVTNGEWTYVIAVSRKKAEPDPETVKTVSDSIRFY